MSITKLAMSRKEAAEALGVSVQSIDRAIKSGELKARRFGHRVLIVPKYLEEFLEGKS